MKRKIFLHGKLKGLVEDGLEFETETVAEAIEALCKQTRGLNPVPGKGRHIISIVGCEQADQLFAPTNMNEIHLMPALVGGKQGGAFQIILGVVLIAVSFYIPGSWAIAGMSLQSIVFSLGLSVALGGLIQLISPAPKLNFNTDNSSDPTASQYLGAPKNTTKIGTRIAFGYGRRMVGGQILSMNIDAVDVAV